MHRGLLWLGFSDRRSNIHHRQGLYFVYVAAFVISVAYSLISIVRSGKKYQTGIDGVLILTILLTAIGIAIQFIVPNVRIDFLCIAISNLLLYSRCYKVMLQVDAVTHLLNRRCYEAAAGDLDSRAVIIFFDINKFKHVNDTYGHSVGDLCLQRIAEQLRSAYGKFGTCYRIGGDEFCVILNSNFDRLEELNAQFTSAVETLRVNDERMPDVALGYAYYDPAASHIQKIIEEADAMMYKSKR